MNTGSDMMYLTQLAKVPETKRLREVGPLLFVSINKSWWHVPDKRKPRNTSIIPLSTTLAALLTMALAIPLPRLASSGLPFFTRLSTATALFFSRPAIAPRPAQGLPQPLLRLMPLAIPASVHASLWSIPALLEGIWESVLRAVPKKKTSHSKKRHRQMAGKALKDFTATCTCPACGEIKRMHYMCPSCVKRMQLLLPVYRHRGSWAHADMLSRTPKSDEGGNHWGPGQGVATTNLAISSVLELSLIRSSQGNLPGKPEACHRAEEASGVWYT